MHGVPAIAASLAEAATPRDFVAAAEEVLGVARRVKQYGLPPGTFLNVNIPARAGGRLQGLHGHDAGAREERRRELCRDEAPGPAARSTGTCSRKARATRPRAPTAGRCRQRLRLGDADAARRGRPVADGRLAEPHLQTDRTIDDSTVLSRPPWPRRSCRLAGTRRRADRAARTSSSSSPTTSATATSAATARPTSRRPTSIGLAREGVRFTDFYAAPTCSPTRASLISGRYYQRFRIERPLPAPGPAGDQGLRADGPLAAGAAQGRRLCHRPDRQVAPRLQAGAEPERARLRLLLRVQERADRLLPAHRRRRAARLLRKRQPGAPSRLQHRSLHRARRAVHRRARLGARSSSRWRSTPRTGRSRCRIVRRWRPQRPLRAADGRGHLHARGLRGDPRAGRPGHRQDSGDAAARGLDRNTLVVFMNDNGGEWLSRNAPLFHRKDSVWEGGVRVPAIMRWPGRIPAGRVTPQVGHRHGRDRDAPGRRRRRPCPPRRGSTGSTCCRSSRARRRPSSGRCSSATPSAAASSARCGRGNWKLLVDGPNTFAVRSGEGRRRAQRPGVVARPTSRARCGRCSPRGRRTWTTRPPPRWGRPPPPAGPAGRAGRQGGRGPVGWPPGRMPAGLKPRTAGGMPCYADIDQADRDWSSSWPRCVPVRRAGRRVTPRGDVLQGRRADSLRQLRLLSSSRRGGAVLAPVLQGRPPWARVDQAAGGPAARCRPGRPTRTSASFAIRAGSATQEIATIVAWVDGGAQRGQSGGHCRRAPQFTEGWQIGDAGSRADDDGAGEDSGDRHDSVRHRIPPTTCSPRTSGCRRSKSARATVVSCITRWRRPNCPASNGPGGGQNVHLYSPGLEAMVWREGYGKFFPKGTRISFQMHYNAIGTRDDGSDARSGFKFATVPVHTQVNTTHRAEQHAGRCRRWCRSTRSIAAFQFPGDARIHGAAAAHAPAGAARHRVADLARTARAGAAAHPALGRLRGRTTTCWRRPARVAKGIDARVPRQLRQLAGQCAQPRPDGGRCRGGSRSGTRCTRST